MKPAGSLVLPSMTCTNMDASPVVSSVQPVCAHPRGRATGTPGSSTGRVDEVHDRLDVHRPALLAAASHLARRRRVQRGQCRLGLVAAGPRTSLLDTGRRPK